MRATDAGVVADAVPSKTGAWHRWWPFGLLAAIFSSSRLAYAVAGVAFDTSSLNWYSQYLPVELLQDDLLVSLANLHAQPPLFNLLLGIVVNSPTAPSGTFQVLFLSMGLAFVLSMYLLMSDLGVPRPGAIAAAARFGVLPSTVVTENLLFYTYPVALLLAVGMLCAGRYLRRKNDVYGVTASAYFAAVVLTRAQRSISRGWSSSWSCWSWLRGGDRAGRGSCCSSRWQSRRAGTGRTSSCSARPRPAPGAA